MRKLLLTAVAIAAMAFAVPAFADEIHKVTDPTPNGAFTGDYDKGDTDNDPNTPNETGSQVGYVAVHDDGVIACNGNPETLGNNPSDDKPLVGYVWVGPNHRASNVTQETPGGEAGAGNNHEEENGAATGDAPCPE